MRFLSILVLILTTSLPGTSPYPLDGYEHSGIRRLIRTQQLATGELKGRAVPAGALKSINDIKLHLLDTDVDLSQRNDTLQRAVNNLFARKDDSYSIAILDITSGRPMRVAMLRPNTRYQPGSVGKLAVLAGLFSELKRIYPDDVAARTELLRSHKVVGGRWVLPNHHTVPVYDPNSGAFRSRAVLESDTFSLFEWADHMISASSNAAASVVWKETMLIRQFGAAYPPSPAQEADFLKNIPRKELGDLAIAVVNEPLHDMGIDEESWRLGLFFTTEAGRMVPASGGSWGTVDALLTYLIRIEQGQIVDEWSSLEIKRLMYQTERRIRYAAASSLSDAAVYFKSGSLYKCDKVKDPACTQYQGNVYNYMNSVATVEAADGRVYLVALMSNVLKKNSSSDHLAIASEIERLLK